MTSFLGREWPSPSLENWAAPAFGNVTRVLRQLALTAVREDSGQLVLREIEDRDLGVLFEHSSDRDAIRMAAFTSPEADDRTSFERRWARLRSDDSTTNKVVEIDGRVVGHVGEGREFAHGCNEETDEVVLRLDA